MTTPRHARRPRPRYTFGPGGEARLDYPPEAPTAPEAGQEPDPVGDPR